MKYLTKELHIHYFCDKDFNKSDDTFLIGILNNNENKLKDVITGEVVENFHFTPITRLKFFRDGGNNMVMGYITGFNACNASIRQRVLAERINSILKNDVLEEKDIIKIKNIMNREIKKNYEKNIAKSNRLIEKEKELNKYLIDESERDF